MAMALISSGSSGWVGGAKKHEIYVAAFGGHLFYDLFVQGWGAWPPWLLLDLLLQPTYQTDFMNFSLIKTEFRSLEYFFQFTNI